MSTFVFLLFLAGWLGTSHFLPWVSWHSEVPFFMVTFLVAWFAIWKRTRSDRISGIALPAPAFPLLILLIVALIQGGTGVTPFLGDVFVFSLYLILCLVCLALGYGVHPDVAAGTRSPRGWKTSPVTLLAVIFVTAGLASVFVALAQTLQVWETSPWILRQSSVRRPGGNLGQPNHLATLLVMAIASMAYLFLSRRMSVVLATLLLFVFCGGLALSESRTGAIAFLLLLGWWVWKQPQVSPSWSRWYALGIAGIFVSLFLSWPLLFGALSGSSESAFRLGSSAGNARAEVWPQLFEAALQRPWFGWGILQTAEAHNSVAHMYSKGEPFSYSHNLVLDLVLWAGFPLAGTLVLLGAFWLWHRARMIQSIVPWYGLAVALPLGVHSMLEFPFAYAYFLVPVMFLVGVMERSLERRSGLRIGFKPAVLLLFLATAASVWSMIEYLSAEDEFRVMRFEMLRIGQTPADHQSPKILLHTQLGALIESTKIEPRPNMPATELDVLKKVALRYPWSATRYRYSLSLALNQQPEEATRQMHIIRVQEGEKFYSRLNQQINAKTAEFGLPALGKLNTCTQMKPDC